MNLKMYLEPINRQAARRVERRNVWRDWHVARDSFRPR